MQQLGQAIKPIPRYPQSETATKEDNNIAMALIAFHQTNPHVLEDKRNPHFRNTYASLESVIKTVRTASQFGLTFTQEMDFEGDISFVRTVMMHSSGAMRVSRTKILMIRKKWGLQLVMQKGMDYRVFSGFLHPQKTMMEKSQQ